MLMQLQDIKKNEDPRLSFSTPEFKEAQRTFTDNLKVLSTARQWLFMKCTLWCIQLSSCHTLKIKVDQFASCNTRR